MPRAKLDRTRSFATVHGPGAPYAYVQDGKQFTGDEFEYIDPTAPKSVGAQWEDTEEASEHFKKLALGTDTFDEATVIVHYSDELDELKMKALRAIYFDLTEKAVAVGVNKEQLREMIRRIRKDRGPTVPAVD